MTIVGEERLASGREADPSSLAGVGDSRARPSGLLLRVSESTGKSQADLFEVPADRIRDPVGVRLEHAVGNTAVIRGVHEVPVPPAEDLCGPALAVAQDETEGPEAGDPVVRIVQAQLGAPAGDLPLGGEFG